ncbi:MAG TPA: hypothetical protein VD790_06380 [Thermoleophilaceae bacterium]|nr:hypothetical protein [Thermoleophilaceae bacterium]
MRAAGAAALFALVAALGGCGGDDEDNGRDAGGLAREASAVVEDLERAIAAGEFDRICAELLSAEVRRQAGGGDCPNMLARTSAGVERPRIEIQEIQIEGATATVEVVTVAEGQARVEDTIRLVREAGAYRISSLSG